MVSRFQCPQYFEGFDSIKFRYNPQDSGVNSSAAMVQQSMLTMDQENPHHIFTLGEHCRKLAMNYDLKDMYKSGMLYDVEKARVAQLAKVVKDKRKEDNKIKVGTQ